MLNLKLDKLKKRLLLTRWAVLALLLVAIGTVAVWGGQKTDGGGAGDLLQAQLQSHIGGDTALHPLDKPAAGDNTDNDSSNNDSPGNMPPEAAELQAVSGSQINGQAGTDPDPTPKEPADNPAEAEANDEGEVYDHAPEPWAGDAALSAEAELTQMLPPLSGLGNVNATRSFGYSYDATFEDYRFHTGLDIAGSPGTAVLAPLPGTVSELIEDSFYGPGLVVQHEGQLFTRYYGVQPQPGLQVGDEVIAGEKLGELSEAPAFEEAQGPHLHWEIVLEGQQLDPAAYSFKN